jgi:hypothetical protein
VLTAPALGTATTIHGAGIAAHGGGRSVEVEAAHAVALDPAAVRNQASRKGAPVEFWTQVWATYTENREQIIPLLAPLATFASGFLTVVVGSVVA